MGDKRAKMNVSLITRENLERAVSLAQSLRQACEILGMDLHSGNSYRAVRNRIKSWGINTSHFNPWGIIPGRNKRKKRPTEELLKKGSLVESARLKARLFKEGILKQECSWCKIGPDWNGAPLVLQLDHINGEKYDNRLENLRILCPNCHSQTETFTSKNKTYK